MPDKDNFGAVLQPVAVDVADALVAKNNQTTGFQTEVCAQPVGYRWQNDRDGLVEDGTAPACRASAGSSGFHEMNHPVVVQQPVAFSQNQREEVRVLDVPGALQSEPATHQQTYIAQPVPFTKAKRAQSTTDDETWVDGKVNPTLSLFDQGDTRATTVAVAFHPTQDPINSSESFHALGTGSKGGCATAAVAHALRGEGFDASEDGTGRGTPLVPQAMTVRRLLPIECERLQAFPDNWTLIPWRGKPAEQCPDGPRYKALGNSMACNCMAWIGERIAAVEDNRA